MPDSESTSVARRIPKARHGTLLRRTRLRDTAIFLALLAGLLWISQPSFAQIPTPTYQYQFTGDFFDTFWCGNAPDCGTPVAPNRYTTGSRVIATLKLSAPLTANMPAQNLNALDGVTVEVDTNDGFTTQVAGPSYMSPQTPGGSPYFYGTACIMTNDSGQISAWYLETPNGGNGSHEMYSLYDPNGNFLNVPSCNTANVPQQDYALERRNGIDPAGPGEVFPYGYKHNGPSAPGSWLVLSATHTIGGSLSGLPTSGSVVLQDNGGDNLTLNSNGTFTFATPVNNGSAYAVTVLSAPAGQYCAVTNGSGTVNGADVSNVQVSCAPSKTYTYSGKGFKLFQCATSPNPDCAAPGPGNPYKTSNSITAALTVASPLPANLGPTDVSGRAGFTLTLSDGLNTLTRDASSCSGCVRAWVTTNANGEIATWYLDTNAGQFSTDMFTMYDPGGVIAAACAGCVSPTAIGNEEDLGRFYTDYPVGSYGYNLNLHGSFSPGYPGGSTTADECRSADDLPCSLVPGNTFAIRGPNAGAIPAGAVLTQQLCVVPADPRGPNCGANNGHRPRSLNVADLPQCKGFGNEVIPDYLCGASGASTTGFALILGNAEQIDTFNGTYGDSELDVDKVPGLSGIYNPTCPKNLPGAPLTRPSAVAAVATRSGSLVEQQTPEQTLDGRPLLLDMTSSCDPPKSNHGPGLTVEGVGFKLRADDPAVIDGLTRRQRLVLFANYKFLNLNAVLHLTKFPTNTPTRKNLQSCINKSQQLLNKGPAHYFCAAEQIYRCEQIVEPGTDFHEFGPSTSPLRLPDPYGDAVRRLGNLYYTINTRINGQHPNSDWPLPASPGHPAGDPYPNLGCP